MSSIINYILTDPVIVPYGAVILAVHVLLCLIFRYLCPDGPWKKLPSFTAHQVIALVFMIYQTYLGIKYYHIHGIFNINEGGLYMAEFSMASMLMWDIPVGLVSDGMGDPIMHLHHVGFFLVASICLGLFSDGVPIGSAYAPFFFGLIEMSSIPLTIVDVFHPRHKQWNETLLTSKTLQTINDICRMLFALLFVLLRVIYFPYVVFSGVFPDCLEGAKERPEFAPTIYFLLGFAVLFTFLQEYWGYLVVRQVIKAMKGGKKVADKKK